MPIAERTNYALDPLGGALDPLWLPDGKHAGPGASIEIVNDPLGGGFHVQRHIIVDGAISPYGGERCEVIGGPIGTATGGGRVQVGYKVLLPSGFTSSSSNWNYLSQLHYPNDGPAQVPWSTSVINNNQLSYRTLGGPLNADGTMGTIQNSGVITTLSFDVWHTILYDILFAHPNGIFDCWVDGVKALELRASTLTLGVPNSTYWKQGFYRSTSAVATNSYFFQDTICWKNSSPDEMLTYYSVTPPPTPPPPSGGGAPAANTRARRFGVATAGAGLNGNSSGYKSGSKFATGLTGSEEADVKDVHVYCAPGDGSSSTQGLTVGLYADDGGNGEPGTKFGESQEILLPGNIAAGWQKITLPSPIRVTGANCWILVGAGAPSNRVFYGTDSVVGGLRYGVDTYESTPPKLSSPAGAMSTADILRSLAADYDVVSVTPPPAPGDTDPPGETSMTIAGAGLSIGYDEPLLPSSTPIGSDYAVIADGVAHSVSSVSVSGSTVTLVLSSGVAPEVAVTISYTRVGGREVKDVAGNLAPNFTAQVVTNNTVPPTNPARTLTIARVIDSSRRVVGTRNVNGLGGGV